MRKPDAKKAQISCEADQHLCSRITESTIPFLFLIQNFQPLAIFCACMARFVSYLVRNPEDRFSHDTAHIIILFWLKSWVFFKDFTYIKKHFSRLETTRNMYVCQQLHCQQLTALTIPRESVRLSHCKHKMRCNVRKPVFRVSDQV